MSTEVVTFLAPSPVIVWFRRDLRVTDNPALYEAAMRGQPVLALYILEDDLPRTPGGAARWWLHHSLQALGRELTCLGIGLHLRRGDAVSVITRLIRETGASDVLWNRRTHPGEAAIDQAVARAAVREGARVGHFNSSLLFEPDRLTTRGGRPFQVFTPFWRCCLTQPEPAKPLPRPPAMTGPAPTGAEPLTAWHLVPGGPDWSSGIAAAWTPGEDAAKARLADFIAERLDNYPLWRDRPGQDGTSRLSAHLAFGEISPRQVWHACRVAGAHPAEGFLRELGWREFCHHTLHHFPDVVAEPLRREFRQFPWNAVEAQWHAFTAGCTGYPIVDAGMRALWETGWLHNRLRMVVGSFLVKDLLIPWQRGECWFWDTLVDADAACNACGWQWVAGCGIESAPYFRIFNPITQGEKFDSHGRYVRRWLPELSKLPDPYIHRPWTAPADVLAKAGVRLGRDYPLPIIEHAAARRRALQAYGHVKGAA